MNATAGGDAARRTIVYVVVDKGANSRVKALGKLIGDGVEVVFVSSQPINVAPASNLVVKYLPNPFGILRKFGLHRLKLIIDSAVYFPSRHRLYVTPVVRKLRRLIADDQAAGKRVVVLTCAPPHTLCLVGQKLKAEFPDVRWIIDWQDLWSHDEVYFNGVFPLYRPKVRRLERDLMFKSDMNVTTNRFAKQAIEVMQGAVPSKVAVINHHFDAPMDDAAGEMTASLLPRTPQRIVFMGGMFKPPKVPGAKFLEALRAARAGGADVELHLYGWQGHQFESFRGREVEFGLVYHGVVPRAEVLSELRKYDYQLLLLEDLPNSKLIMHLKLPDYLRAGLPIIAIVPKDSAVEDIVERTGTGLVIAANSDWAMELVKLFGGGWVHLPERNEQEIAQFEWRHVEREWRVALGLPATEMASAPAAGAG